MALAADQIRQDLPEALLGDVVHPDPLRPQVDCLAGHHPAGQTVLPGASGASPFQDPVAQQQ